MDGFLGLLFWLSHIVIPRALLDDISAHIYISINTAFVLLEYIWERDMVYCQCVSISLVLLVAGLTIIAKVLDDCELVLVAINHDNAHERNTTASR